MDTSVDEHSADEHSADPAFFHHILQPRLHGRLVAFGAADGFLRLSLFLENPIDALVDQGLVDDVCIGSLDVPIKSLVTDERNGGDQLERLGWYDLQSGEASDQAKLQLRLQLTLRDPLAPVTEEVASALRILTIKRCVTDSHGACRSGERGQRGGCGGELAGRQVEARRDSAADGSRRQRKAARRRIK
jgi:hypothetical protein